VQVNTAQPNLDPYDNSPVFNFGIFIVLSIITTMNRCLELLDLPNEVLERIGHFLYERPDVHIESSSGSTPTLRYKQCSKQVEELL
jgi:hypothetical protein